LPSDEQHALVDEARSAELPTIVFKAIAFDIRIIRI
jgi:hypothetical protein